MSKQSSSDKLLDKKFLSLLIVSGVLISATTFIIMVDNFGDTESKFSKEDFKTLCDNGICVTTDTISQSTFVQQSVEPSTGNVLQKNEEFPSINSPVTMIEDFVITENVATLYASKDSFLRESIKESNEGSNDILRVMGAGPTNNRVLIAFDQSQILTALNTKSLESATLRVFVVSNDGKWSDSKTLNIHRLTADWKEGNGINAPFGNFIGI